MHCAVIGTGSTKEGTFCLYKDDGTPESGQVVCSAVSN